MEKENLIMQYISVWGWYLLGMIFLISAFIILFSGEYIGNNVMFVVFIVSWILCIYTSFKRKNKLKLNQFAYDTGESDEDE